MPKPSSASPAATFSAASLRDSESRAIIIGVACTVLFHLLLLLLAPLLPADRITGSSLAMGDLARPNKGADFNIELTDPVTQAERDPFRFVETNPDAPANEPDKTVNFSNRDQQSAQAEKATELDPENRPSVQGRDDIQNENAIVSGDMAKPQDGAAVTALENLLEAAEAQAAQQARAEQIPLTGHEKLEGLSEDGVGTNISQVKSPSNRAEQLLEGAKEGTNPAGALTEIQQADRPTPRPRPRLTQARPNPLQNRLTGTSNIGILGIDARWSEYGEYMQEFIEIIQASWYAILRDSRISPRSGTNVIVTFTLNSAGEVYVVTVEETAGKPGAYACTNAITTRQPYRKWTDQMIAVLGDSQTLTFSFYYY